MNEKDWNTICRICLEEKQSYFLIPISVTVEEGSIIDMIKYCSSIIISADEMKFATNVCHQCLQQLKVGCEIKRKCLESNEKLNSFLNNIKNEPIVEFVEINEILDDDVDNHDILKDDNYSDHEDTNLIPAIENDIIPVKRLRRGGRKSQPKQIILPLHFPKTFEKPSFICDFCGLVVKHKSHLMVHFRKEHKSKREITCNLCNLEFRYVSALNVHKKYHRGERHFKCDQCPKQFILNCELIRHKKNHTGQNMNLCNFCGKVFSSHYLKIHEVTCEKKAMKNPEQLENAKLALLDLQIEYTCDLCNLKLKGKLFLKTHIQRTHLKKPEDSSQKVFHCDFLNCDKKFQQRYNLVVHKRIHNNRSRFPCDKCSRTFIKEVMLIKHRDSPACQGNSVRCLICQKLFRTTEILEKHHSHKHVEKEKKDPGPKPILEFFCEFCGKRINSRSSLQKHVMVNHKDESKYKEYPVFKCRFCIKEFLYRHDLKIHECYHTNERPFKCDIPGCTKAYVQKNKLMRHQQNHTKEQRQVEKPFKCTMCPKAYAKQTLLDKHIATHNFDKAFGCNQCVRSFKTKKVLSRHKRQKHKDV